MFKKILIANRGEIAVRIIRACHELGIEAVAIYSDVDRDALHVRYADEAYPCGPPPAAESYLKAERVIEIAKRCGAEAIHPGYGFLSERGFFPDLCRDAGIVFIGPTGDVMRTMGDKVTARQTMQKAGVPIVPGVTERQSDDEADAWIRKTGPPVMIKASAGGGAHLRTQLRRHPVGRRLLDHLLMTALHRAFALEEMDRVPVPVGEDLDLDVARLLDELL